MNEKVSYSSTVSIEQCNGLVPGPSGIPGYPGIPGLNSNPDPGILENIIPGFLGIYHIKQNHDFKDFYWLLT